MNENDNPQEFFKIFNQFPEGVCVLNHEYTVLFWNHSLENWTGIPADQILGTDIRKAFPHLYQAKYSRRLQPIFAGGPPTIFSSQLHQSILPSQLPDGRWRVQHTTVTAMLAPDQQQFYALLAIEDVTDLTYRIQMYRLMRDQAWEEIRERKRIEVVLRESQHFIKKITDAAPYILYIYDLQEERNVYINQQIDIILGYNVSEVQNLKNQLLLTLMHPDDLAAFPQHLTQLKAAKEGEIVEWEYRLKHASGEWRWLHSRELVFQRTENGEVKQILGTAEDISDRKRASESISKQAEQQHLMSVIVHHIRRSLDLEEVLTTAVTEIRSFLQSDRVAICSLQMSIEDGSALGTGEVKVESVGSPWDSILGAQLACTHLETCDFSHYMRREAIAISHLNPAQLPLSFFHLLSQWQVQAFLEVPILQGEQLWGLLMVHQCSGPREWQPLEIDLIGQLADQLAIAIQQAELYEQLQQANQELQRLATSDGLTRLANRRRFDQYLNEQWLSLAREQQPLSLILCDIDFFKAYNDTYGHVSGDQCLQQVAMAIATGAKRPADLVARYGGEEFAVILPNTGGAGAIQVAQEIRANIKQLQIPHRHSPISSFVTLSLGIACLIPRRNGRVDRLLQQADRALYQAKAQGRDCLCTFANYNV